MLFHVTMSHTEDNCPQHDAELRAQFMEARDRREEIAGRHGVALHPWLTAGPEHLFFVMLEAEGGAGVNDFLRETAPFRHSSQVRPVVTAEEQTERLAGQGAAGG